MSTDPALDSVVTLDLQGRPMGRMSKRAAHTEPGSAHLAFSVLLFDASGNRALLQRRAATSHHFRGYWSNSCCSHPRPGEPLVAAAERRVWEELGAACDELVVQGGFWYAASDPATGLVEREYDLVLRGRLSSAVDPDPEIVAEVSWCPVDELEAAGGREPLTPWYRQVIASALGAPSAVPGDLKHGKT